MITEVEQGIGSKLQSYRLTPLDVPHASAASPFRTNAITPLQLPQSSSQNRSCMTPVMQTPVWPETLMSDGQRHKTAGILSKIPAPPYYQYHVSWFEHCGIEEEIANLELFKFMDNNTNRNPFPQIKTHVFPLPPSSEGTGVLQHGGQRAPHLHVDLSHGQVWYQALGSLHAPPPVHQLHYLGVKTSLGCFKDGSSSGQSPKAEIIKLYGIGDKPVVCCPCQSHQRLEHGIVPCKLCPYSCPCWEQLALGAVLVVDPPHHDPFHPKAKGDVGVGLVANGDHLPAQVHLLFNSLTPIGVQTETKKLLLRRFCMVGIV
jgi:hypothetical protein